MRAGLPCPSHTAVAEHMLAAVSDPTMSQCLINHVDRKGPYAGVARVSDQKLFHKQAPLVKRYSKSCCVPAIAAPERGTLCWPVNGMMSALDSAALQRLWV